MKNKQYECNRVENEIWRIMAYPSRYARKVNIMYMDKYRQMLDARETEC